MKLRWTTLAVIAIVFSSAAILAQQDAERELKRKQFWMQKKLDYSQKILSGLATEDFKAIHENATAMGKLNILERFFHAKTKEYQTQLKIFGYANQELVRLADEKNIDGAALAYMQLTMSCVNCHKLLRKPENAAQPAGSDESAGK